jgi:protocatechuate 3,4-dioxygenase beta subunit
MKQPRAFAAIFDRGLRFDLQMLERRRALQLIAGAAVTLPFLSCGQNDGNPQCLIIPSEPAGPYPGDGSNGVNALTQSGIVRKDIRSSFGSLTGSASGIPLTLNLTLLDSGSGKNCAPLSGRAIYIWHATNDGKYSLYSVPDQNYLRGVLETDAEGKVSFQTIFPGCYEGRYPHIHMELFSTLAKATASSPNVKTTEIALPTEACGAVYATGGYEVSAKNFAKTKLSSDIIFFDGSKLQVPNMTGNLTDGFVASLTLGL